MIKSCQEKAIRKGNVMERKKTWIYAALALLAFGYQCIISRRVENMFINHHGGVFWCARIAAFACTFLIVYLCLRTGWALVRRDFGDLILQTVLFALPYMLALFVFFLMIRPDITTGDEGIILENALQLRNYPEFHFFTSASYVISLMLIPDLSAPVIVKIFCCGLLCGYSVMRALRVFKSRYFAMLMYIPFFLFPTLAYCLYAHRIGFYFIWYGLFFGVLVFDWMEKNRSISDCKMCLLALLAACLAQWRPEGIPLVLFSVFMMYIAYDFGKKRLIMLLLLTIFCNMAVYVPQSMDTFSGREHYSQVRLHPLYSYKITNMLRCGLDREQNADDLTAINKVISIDAIDKLNRDLGDENYRDGYIRWKDGYIGVRELYSMDYYRRYAKGEIDSSYGGFGSEEYLAYAAACKNIFINNPVCFLKATWGSFHYTASKPGWSYLYEVFAGRLPHITYLVHNLYIVLIIVAAGIIVSIIRHNRFLLCVFGELLIQAGIVFVLSPGGYFKYYFPVYFVAYYLSMIGLVHIIKMIFSKHKNRERTRKDAKG